MGASSYDYVMGASSYGYVMGASSYGYVMGASSCVYFFVWKLHLDAIAHSACAPALALRLMLCDVRAPRRDAHPQPDVNKNRPLVTAPCAIKYLRTRGRDVVRHETHRV